MESVNIIAYTKDKSEIKAIEAVLNALKIKFEFSKENPYNPKFVKKIKRSETQIRKGKYTSVKKNNIDNFIASL